MFDVGRVCIKIAGRDAGRFCVVVDVFDDGFVLIDGDTRRRKVNVKHLEPTDKVAKISKGASHEEVVKVFESLGLSARTTKPKQAGPRPRKVRKKKEYPVEEDSKKSGSDKKSSKESSKEVSSKEVSSEKDAKVDSSDKAPSESDKE